MMKKRFNILSLFAVLSVACFVVHLYFRKDSTLFVKSYHVEKDNNTLYQVTKEQFQQENSLHQWTTELVLQDGDLNLTQKETEMAPTPSKTLGPCPDTPPNLVGPLHVEFNSKRTLDDIRKELSSLLQEGGRYKPPDCIAQQKVAVIIAFRNRHEHLKHWLYYLHPILIRQQLDYTVYIINQDGEGVFNRAKLMNAGYVEALKEYDYDCFVFSDIDLVPINDRNLYRCFNNPRHLAVAMDKFNYQLPYNTYFGGVSSLSKTQYLKINGFPNTYWGWGGEDDDIYKRIVYRGMSISRPDSVMGKYKMIKHERDLHNEANPKNPDKLSQTRWAMDTDGINSLKYTVKEIVKDVLYTFINVDIDAPLR